MLDYRPMAEFSYDFGKRKLVSLDSDPCGGRTASFFTPGGNERLHDYTDDGATLGFTEGQGKLLRISATIDLQSRLTVGCAGAVLAYIGRHSFTDSMPGRDGSKLSFGVKSIQTFNIDEIM